MNIYSQSNAGGDNRLSLVHPDGVGRFVLSCPKEMDWQARVDLVAVVRQATANQDFTQLIVDMDGVNYLNSAGIGAIFGLRKHVIALGGEIIICGANPTIHRLLQTVNMAALMPVVSDLDAARSTLEKDESSE